MLLPKLLACSVTLSALAFAAEPTPSAGLPRATPESQGISSTAVLNLVKGFEEKVDAVHSFVLVRHGQVVAEGWWDPYSATEPHELFSLSKSFTSMAVGLAASEGKLSVMDTVLSFFPDKAPKQPSDNLKALRIRDLLTMSTGHHDEVIKTFPFQSNEDLVAKFLEMPIAHKPGTYFVYNTPATYMLSAIVQKVTGETVLDYLRPRLFEPLGIANPRWAASAQGITFGGFGLALRTEDLAKFGQLLLQRGRWGDRQLVPAAWIDDATSRQMSNGSSPESDWDQGYGYQFSRCRHGVYRGDGAFGQFCIVMPQYDAVIAVTSGTNNMGAVMSVVWDRLLPALKDTELPSDETAHRGLAEKLAHLRLPTPQGSATGGTESANVTYVLKANPAQLEKLTLASGGSGTKLAVTIAGHDQTLEPGFDVWRKGEFLGQGPEVVATAGAWTSSDTYTLKICLYHTPMCQTYQLHFAPQQLTIEGSMNTQPQKFEWIGTPSGNHETR